MYKLEINLLRDRYSLEKFQRPAKGGIAVPTWEKQAPLIVGGVIMLLLPALAAGGIWFISWQTGKTQEQIDYLDTELSRLKTRIKSLTLLQEETKKINQETKTLVSVFNYIKPWSAILNDIKSRTPPQLQITSIQEEKVKKKPENKEKQNEDKKPEEDQKQQDKKKPEDKKSPSDSQSNQAPEELSSMGLKIQGYARTYQEINDFLLSLQASKFLIPEATAITSAELVELPIKWQGLEDKNTLVQLKFPQVIEYTIETQLTQVPAAQLLEELKIQGANGLVTRLKTLEKKGAIQP